MAITDKKISVIYPGRDISSLSDRPNQDGMTATELKARFDQLGKEIIPKINDLIDELFADFYSGAEQTGHTHNIDNLVDGLTYKLFTAVERAKLGAIAEGAEVNQNAFSNVKVGSTTIASTTKTDTFELVAGLNITMTVDALTKKISLSATGDLATEAVQSLIIDIGNYYEALNVEDALQELGAVINGLLRSEAYFDFDSNQQMVTLNFQDGTSLNLGSELWYAQGKAVGSIANGDNVMLAGSQGDHYLVKKAVASELATNPQLYLGVATKGSANNEWAKITRLGLVNDVNTNGWAYGTKLYFNPVTLGFTDVLPSLPNARIEVGMVVRQHATDGVILVLPFALNLYTNAELDAMLSAKQATLISGTNIKTINGNSVLGGGDIPTMLPKNWIINGMFDVWQRGVSQTTSGYGSDDRFLNSNNVSTKTHSRQAFTIGQVDVPNNPTYFSRTAVITGNTASANAFKAHWIEDVTKLAGKTVTLSFWAKANSNKNIAIEFRQYFGTGGSSMVDAIDTQKVALTSTWQKIVKTVLLPSISGKTIGVGNALVAQIWFDAGSDYNARTDSLGNQSGTFDIANVSLVEGSVAVECQNQPYADVLYACGYYFQKIYVKWREGVTVTKQYNNIPVLGITPKRKVPAVTISNILSNEGTTYTLDDSLSPNLEMGTLVLLWDYTTVGIADISFICSLDSEL